MLSNPDASLASASKKPDSSSGHKSHEGFKRKNDHSQGDGNKKKKGDNQYVPLYHVHTELYQPWEQIYLANEKHVPFRRADPLKGPRSKRDLNKYFRHHRDRGHTTDECRQLKDKIAGLISRGYLRHYVGNRADQPQNYNNERQAQPPQVQPRVNQAPVDDYMPPLIEGADIVTIVGGPHPAGQAETPKRDMSTN